MSFSIIGTGSYLPERVLTNADLEKMVDTTDEWIVTRTGMRERRLATDAQASSDLGLAAARRALDNAGLPADQLDMIITASVTPDMFFPSTACLIQGGLGAKKAFAFDLNAACSGFLYAMEIGRRFIVSQGARNVLLVGAEKFSSIVDWTDRDTCVLFGDGAGAMVMQASGASRGFRSLILGSDGSLGEILKVEGWGSRHMPADPARTTNRPKIKMLGREVFRHAVHRMTEAGRQALAKAGVTRDDIRWVIPHQANLRILQAACERIEVPMDRCYVNLDRVGNISSASVPVAIDEAVRGGKIQRGDLLLILVAGAGFTWGGAVLEW